MSVIFILFDDGKWLIKGFAINHIALFIAGCRFAIAMIYYTLNLNTGNLGGDDIINCFISAALEMPAYLSVYLVLSKIGRRFIMIAYLLLSAAACVATPLIAESELNQFSSECIHLKF